MTARESLVRVRHALAITLVLRALCVAVAVSLGSLAIARLLGAPSWATALAIVAGLAAGSHLLLPLRVLRSLPRVALWVEERHPALRYALVTAADGVHDPALEAHARSVAWERSVRAPMARALAAPLLALLAMGAVTLWNPRGASANASDSAMSGGPHSASGPTRDVLAGIIVAVIPPAYAGRPATTLDDPTSIDALVGSVVRVSGEGDARLVIAVADSASREVSTRDGRWSTSLVMPARPAIVRLRSAAGRERLIVLAPVIDAVPAVTLLFPARDSIMRIASGPVYLRAQLRDDIGLRDAAFELVVSTGQGENFTFRTATIGRGSFRGRSEAMLDARLSLDSLALQPGDVLQLRAVARDANDVTGPGVGSSETRSFRVARAGEYDSVSIEAAPPTDAETQVLSQRMLIMLTEAVVKRRSRIPRTTLVTETRRIAMDQRRLRKRVGDVVFQRLGGEPLSEEGSDVDDAPVGKITPEELLKRAEAATNSDVGTVMDVEGDETPILAVNKPLLEAFNAMWEAQRALEIGEPARALPSMRIALAAIQRAREAERIYLRGRPSAIIVDVAKVRLSGKDKGQPAARESRAVVDPVLRRRSATFERVTALLARDPDAAADSLLLLRVEALSDAPALASALDEAAQLLRRGEVARIPLAWMRVRRLLGGEPVRRAGVSPWLGAP